jgi:PAS domain S-box-containing protein
LDDVYVCVRPGDGGIFACSQAMQAVLGYQPEDLVGQTVRVLAASGDAEDAWNAIAGCLELSAREIHVRHHHGGRVAMTGSATAMRGGDGEIRYGLLSLRNRPPQSQAGPPALACAVALAEARERERIARGLHDVVGQLHTLLGFKLDELEAGGPCAGNTALLGDIRLLLRQAAQATRATTFDLSNPLVGLLGLAGAIESLGEGYGLPLRVEAADAPPPLPEPVLAVVFRVVRELLFNIRKHAQARQVLVSMAQAEGCLLICVCDDGMGFDASALDGFRPEGGFGLASASACMLSLGGRLEIDSAPRAGTRATLSVPLAGPENSSEALAWHGVV